MVTNPVIEAIKLRRAIRSYEDKPVLESVIQTMLEAATYAPSAINVQPWKFTIVTKKAEMNRLSDIAKPALVRALPDVGDEGLVGLKKRLTDPNYNIFYNAPLLIFVSGAKSPYVVYDCTMAAQNMMLAAYTLGIGSCWIGTAVPTANDPKIKPSLGIPEDHDVHAAVIFGYPKGGFPKAPLKSPAQILKRID
ncbi:MAG: nitroreductase family protein [Candidatus Bathyarchaeia archaeon]|jgi:nitroreductase